MNKLEIKNLSKTIGANEVLKNINIELESGKIYVFQGDNGCGKTMLFRVASALSAPTKGEVLYNNINVHKTKSKTFKVGIIIENATLFPQFTALQNLVYLAKINNYISENDCILALERVGLDPYDKRTVRKYSLGMKQRLLIAQAIMEKPDIVFFDEPTNAIDREGVKLVYKIIKEEAQRGAIVLMTSHVDKDVSQLSEEKFLMEKGEIIG